MSYSSTNRVPSGNPIINYVNPAHLNYLSYLNCLYLNYSNNLAVGPRGVRALRGRLGPGLGEA